MKMENGTLKLKNSIKTHLYGVTFSKGIALKYFTDDEGQKYVIHPKYDNSCAKVSEDNISKIKEHIIK